MSDDRFAGTDPFLDELESKGYIVIHRNELEDVIESLDDVRRKLVALARYRKATGR